MRDISGGGLVNGNGGRGGRMSDMRGGGGCLCMYGLGVMCWCCGGGGGATVKENFLQLSSIQLPLLMVSALPISVRGYPELGTW